MNTAARMESHGVAGEIQISGATRELLGEDFIVQGRGRIPIKGIGEMETFMLLGPSRAQST